MEKCDFTFRGESLSSYDLIMCNFSNPSLGPVATDSQRTFTSIPMFGGRRFPFLFTTYDSTLVITFSVCKAPKAESEIITPLEAAVIKRWLSSPTPEEFRIDAIGDYAQVRWYGSFNVEEVHYYGDCVGFNLTFTSTAPFGYYDDIELSGEAAANVPITIYDISDEEGYLYPDLTVTLKEGGNLVITNELDGRTTVVNNCTSGESIKFSHLLQISSSISSHKLGNDFNYRFLRINNKYDNTVNKISFSLPCEYKLTYRPIAKVVFA